MESGTDLAPAALAYLKRDRFRHIMLLKYWQAFAADTSVRFVQDGSRTGVRLLVPTARSPYDRKTYPQTRLVAFLRADGPDLGRALLEDLPRTGSIIFKLVDPADIAAVRAVLPVVRQTSFVSFTSPPRRPDWQAHSDVRVTSQPAQAALPLHARQGYDATEVMLYAREQEGRFYAIGDTANVPLGACFSFRNFEDIHEIGGLFTLPAARRRGVGRHLVETALATLGSEDLIPRYQVHESNTPSIALAERLGLRRAVTAEHWLYTA